MSNVRVAFKEYDGELTQDDKPKGYKFVSIHVVFDVKLGEKYRRKAKLAADRHKTDAPTSTITYSSRDSVRIALTVAAPNDLTVNIFACDIQNAVLTAPYREKLHTTVDGSGTRVRVR
jgi:hypothetical protein